jgi:hypothetical protein
MASMIIPKGELANVEDLDHKAKVIKDNNSFGTIRNMIKRIEELTNVGYSLETRELTCKECGGISKFRLPLSAGLDL